MTLLVVGESLVDVIEHADGTRSEHPGGSPFNVARGASRLSVDTELATQLGTDEYGSLLRSCLHDDAVMLSPLTGDLTRTSVARATLDAAGNATYQFDVEWGPTSFPDPSLYEAIHIGSLGTFLEPGASAVADLALSADVLGVPVCFDVNVRTSICDDPDLWNRAFARVCGYARILRLSEDDAAVLFEDTDVLTVASELSMDGALVTITRGAAGSCIAQGGRIIEVPAAPTQVVDTIGAGDSYTAAVLAWFSIYNWPDPADLHDTELLDLATYASRAAAITVARPGADPPFIRDL